MVEKKSGVGFPFPQRRQMEVEDVEPVVEILAELAGRHLLFERSVGSGDDPHIDLNFLLAAQREKLAVIEHRQQLDLERQRHIADLGEKQGAALGEAEHARLVLDCAGEGPLDVAKQLGLKQGSGKAPQLILIKGLLARLERLWMASATLSLPVPVSPVISTEASVWAIRGMRSKTSRIFGLWPMIDSVTSISGPMPPELTRAERSSRTMTRPDGSSARLRRGERVKRMGILRRSRLTMSPSITRGSLPARTSRKVRPRWAMLERRTKSTYTPLTSARTTPVKASRNELIITILKSRSTTAMPCGTASSRLLTATFGNWVKNSSFID